MNSFRHPSSISNSKKLQKKEREWLGVSFKPENFIPGLIIGFIFGLFVDVFVVRQDLKMGAGKIASQCAHAATGMYSELMQSNRYVLRQWELCGQAKIVVTCKNQQEMNKLKDAAESIGLPTFTVADAGRTQVSAGSKTVLAIGPGNKSAVDSVTGKQRLL
ncbi:Peptidyl-tRNA hydrolase II (PTH2) family protein [Striga hermonthica]|uniref:peptidyl-tRNA hydrolase n=1 Tax=Striga hermonthica TaxID=68872 RepID=A0A9N7NXL4_STRHE|nr:Peptidyl-tRNA hydrolase II (PTH2) family protein [Striga hermonthica]